MTTADAFADLEPRLVWERFAELTRIPRPPKEEDEARAHVLRWARERGFESAADAAGNVVVQVPASPGRETAPTVVLQAHLDMVCERDPDSPYDPREGRIHVVREGDWVAAEGTTLGADDGIGVAAALAAAEDPELAHGPLELLLTVSEEQGLDGAKELDHGLVAGRLLLNLDGSDDARITIGCAGSAHAFLRLPLPQEEVGDAITLRIAVSGARGGHSGADIARGRANAVKALGRVLAQTYEHAPFRLAVLNGGVSRNAIPREAEAVVALDAREADFRDGAEQVLASLREQFATSDAGIELTIEADARGTATSADATRRALDLLAALPSGVLAMSAAFPGTVETSTSLNVASTDGDVLTLASMARSSSAVALEEIAGRYAALARLARSEAEIVRSYPPWRPDLDSALLSAARTAYVRLFGSEPALEVVHGGLECAVLGGKLPGVEMISLGPETTGLHAPGERLGIPGTQRFYRLLEALLGDLSS